MSYYDGQYDTAKAAADSGEPTRQWVLKVDEDGFCDLDDKYFVSGDKFCHASNGEVTLPLGTVLIRESKAPEGYLLSNEVYVRNITSDGHAEMVKTYKEPTTPEQVKRGDLDFVKVKDSSMARLAGVPFKITSKTTGESHIIVTDANGYANTSSSWNLHTNNTNWMRCHAMQTRAADFLKESRSPLQETQLQLSWELSQTMLSRSKLLQKTARPAVILQKQTRRLPSSTL